MNTDLDALAIRLYVTIDDLLIDHPDWRPERPAVGIAPKLTDAELITLAVIQALLGFTSETRFIRHAQVHLTGLFPYLPQRPAYNKRLRNAAATMQHIIGVLARDCPSWHDDLWLVDSTPVECGRSRETVKRSDMAGWATYGYCASHSRFFWGLRLHLIAIPSGLPVAYALTGAKTDERDTALAMLHLDPTLDRRPGQVLMADKGYRSTVFEAELNAHGITLIRPTIRSDKTERPHTKSLKPFRQIIESINQTLKAQQGQVRQREGPADAQERPHAVGQHGGDREDYADGGGQPRRQHDTWRGGQGDVNGRQGAGPCRSAAPPDPRGLIGHGATS